MRRVWQAAGNAASSVLNGSRRLQRRRKAQLSGSMSSGMESLEVRQLLTAVPWENSSHLTASIVPDGTDVEGQKSSFFSTFSYLGSPTQLQQAIGEVFQTWTSQINVNIGFVPDGGQPLGTPGATQGDLRFGDIRIAAVPMSQEVYAFAVPHSGGLAGTLAGDIVFNSAARLASIRQFKSVLMHEVGHVLGLSHSSTPSSPMFLHNSPTSSLTPTAEDIAVLIQQHGARTDAQDAVKSNNVLSNASDMRTTSFDGRTPLLQYGDVSRGADIDFYRLNALSSYSGPVTVRMRVHGLSQLQGSLTVVDRNGRTVASALSTTPGGDAVVTFNQNSREKYFLRIAAANPSSLYSVGRYAAVVTYDSLNTATAESIESVPAMNVDFLEQSSVSELFLTGRVSQYFDDLHTNDVFTSATTLKTTAGFAEATAYSFGGTISDLTDIDFYRVRSPSTVRTGDVMVVSLEIAEVGTLIPQVTVLDSSGRALPVSVLRNGAGRYTVQVSGITSKSDYFVKVQRDPATTASLVGNYSLRVRFGAFAEQTTDLFTGQITSSGPRNFYTLEMTQTRLLAVSLAPTGSSASNPNLAVQVTIFDAAGNEIYRLASIGGQIRTADTVLLKAGSYFVRFNAAMRDGSAIPNVGYKLSAAVLSDDTGPLGTNPTDAPPIDAALVDVVVISNPTLTPPPTLGEPPVTENPWIFQTNPFEDWYWFFGVM